jgi:HAD superfamily hydrolase (TIGR01509 family)
VKPLSFYQAAIFDLDGVLADSMDVWDRICRDWLVTKNKNPPPELEDDIALMTLNQAAEYVSRRFHLAYTQAEILGQWEALVLWRYENTVPLKEGAAELVRFLAEQGVKLAIASSSFPSGCEAVLRRHGIRDYFSVLIYSAEVGRDKRFPDIWLACAGKLKIAPEKCLVFEDLYDALAGVRAAGMDFAAVYDRRSKRWNELRAEADRAILSFREMLCSIKDSG